jgi:hypothetical protein
LASRSIVIGAELIPPNREGRGLPLLSGEARAEFNYYRRFARTASLAKLEQWLQSRGVDQTTATLHVAQGVTNQVIKTTALAATVKQGAPVSVNCRLFPTVAAMKTLPTYHDMSDEDIEVDLATLEALG